ncbi:NUDIX domain-containing protein [Georgenia satyanarayanai]|uniref:NUDIX domain-containing protein n=1 Tax=Georgenia satyanarayanai TaxID=860221 RepID=UPI00203B4EAD|nr:NUDIX domain-containing protein [Georgenia satyanarayanai]MCM3659642.1 NUDIX domain-containing protein [Georgenia satyanarayanai]
MSDPSGNGPVHRYRVVPAAYVVLLREEADGADSALLQLRTGTGFMDGHWACGAAGHVEAGESVLAAAAREAAEELGVEVGATELLPLTVMHRTQGTGLAVDERVDFFFSCRRWRGEPRPQEDKVADLRWVRLDALDSLAEPVVPHERQVLDGLAADTLTPVTTFGFAQH